MAINSTSLKEKQYKTTYNFCNCPDRKQRNDGSYTHNGERVCLHIKDFREAQDKAKATINMLYPMPQNTSKPKEEWKVVDKEEAQTRYPIGLTTKEYGELMMLKDVCQQFVEAVQEMGHWTSDKHHVMVPVFVIKSASKMNQVLKELA